MTIEIKLASECQTSAIRSFIQKNWKQNHVFVTDEDFFNYEMCSDGRPNFILALSGDNILGLLGFISYAEYFEDSDLFLVLFKVLKSSQDANLGIRLIEFAKSLTTRGLHSVGVAPAVIPYYRFLGFQTGLLDHYFWLNDALDSARQFIVGEEDLGSSNAFSDKPIQGRFTRLDSSKDFEEYLTSHLVETGTLKRPSFFKRRFFQHPVYSYEAFSWNGLRDGATGVGIVRPVKVNDMLAYRIIDWFGPMAGFPGFCSSVIDHAADNGAAFVDLYVSGIDGLLFQGTGLRSINDQVVIPNYLEPVVMKNVPLAYVTTARTPPVFFRGDGDQDRPSRGRHAQ